MVFSNAEYFKLKLLFLKLEGVASYFYKAIIYEIRLWWKSLTDGSGTL